MEFKGKFITFLFFVFLLTGETSSGIYPHFLQQNDTLHFIAIQGKITDINNGNPVVFASIYIIGTNIGTVANSEGRFLLKVPAKYKGHLIGFSSTGYKTSSLPISKLTGGKPVVRLIPDIISIPAVIIEKLDPVALLREAIRKIPENYPDIPTGLTAFYRESIRKGNNKYLSVGEAVLDVYKASYKNILGVDRVRVYKGRKGEYVRREDTLMVKLQGGPVTAFYLDLAKNPGDILSPDVLDYYNFSMGGQVKIDNRKMYVIHFDQKDAVSLPLYSGIIYLDAKSLAITGAEYEISPKQIEKAAKYLIIKKPANLKINVLSGTYMVKYRLLKGKWVLNYMRLENHFRCKWAKKLFRSNYTILAETAITNVNFSSVEKPRYRDTFKWKDIFTDKVSAFEDPEFWGPDNVIQPEQSIQAAIRKISRKLKRHGKQ